MRDQYMNREKRTRVMAQGLVDDKRDRSEHHKDSISKERSETIKGKIKRISK